ncbi:hypothetical protein HMPREF1624_00705 [Sporothrix schenckii ATCC 58251]|uniref:Uncharacterized protein n=1 Tax=Sporothrix schenckii (strain ATCC 58251 / de Perez 2211183) TaxID=1391915 RepID=U7Q5H5_SPOS1|nr:hypothetical protein HMPREF1624_00705 [Sporothrix schenckii ATCC 58251]
MVSRARLGAASWWPTTASAWSKSSRTRALPVLGSWSQPCAQTPSGAHPSCLTAGSAQVGVFLNLSGGGGPDGLAMDVQGGLVVAQPSLGVLRLMECTSIVLY